MTPNDHKKMKNGQKQTQNENKLRDSLIYSRFVSLLISSRSHIGGVGELLPAVPRGPLSYNLSMV